MKLKILSSTFIVFGLINAQSYSLEECISIALQNKESLKASALNVESARLGTKESLSGILPTINYSGGWSQSEYKLYNFTTGKLSDKVTTTNWETGISVSQTIYDGGIWWNNINSAKNDYRIAAQFQRQVLTNIINGVHLSFFNYLKSQQLLEVAQLNRKSSARQMELVKRQYELGAVNKTDLLKAEVSLGQAEIDVISQESELKNSFRELKNSMGLMGSEVDFEVADSGKPLELVPDYTLALQTMDSQNPSLKAKRYQVLRAQLNHKLIKGQRLPSLRASFSYGASADSLGGLTDNWKDNTRSRTGLTLSLPLFTGNSLSTKTQQAKLSINKQNAEYLNQRKDLMVTLNALLDLLQNYSQIIPINEKVLTSAEEDLKLAQERYSLGAATILEVLDAQVSVIRAKSALITTKYNARIQQAGLKALMGLLDSDLL